jgi:hypothetical protein
MGSPWKERVVAPKGEGSRALGIAMVRGKAAPTEWCADNGGVG